MSNELNLTKEEIAEGNLEATAGNQQETVNENKIVPIANKVESQTANDNTDTPVIADAVADTSADSNPDTTDAVTATTTEHTSTTTAAITNNSVTDKISTTNASAAVTNESSSDHPAGTAPVPEVSNDIPKEPRQSRRKYRKIESESHYYDEEPEEEFHFADEERPRRPFFSFRSANEEESRDRMILSRIKDEDLMEYLALEQRRLEFLQQAKEVKQKRILTAFQLLISLAAIVAITYLLKDNPTILISILYIVGIVAALNIWKNPQDKGKGKWRK